MLVYPQTTQGIIKMENGSIFSSENELRDVQGNNGIMLFFTTHFHSQFYNACHVCIQYYIIIM